MNNVIPASDFSLPTQVSIRQIPTLHELEKLLTSNVYVVHYPEGVSGELMTLRSGELEGKKTTSIMSEDGIVATAGLERVTLAPVVAQTLMGLRHFGVLAGQVNQLLGRIRRIESYLYQKSKAELDNIFIGLRDLSRRMPDFLADASYKSHGLTQLAMVKKTVGEYFQLQLGTFEVHVQGLCNETSNRHEQQLIVNFSYLRSQPVFKAFELLAVVELLEIAIDGRYTDSMFSAARQHLKDRSDQIMVHVGRLRRSVESELANRLEYQRQQFKTFYDHQASEKGQEEFLLKIDEHYQQTKAETLLLDNLLGSELDRASVENLLVSVKQGLLMIEEEKNMLPSKLSD